MEAADQSTLFLDEIGDLSLGLQPKLLRVLQERSFERLGSNNTVNVNLRVICATNRNLTELVEQGKFREDLYYRLNVVPLRLPPLRERSDDVPDLVRHFLTKVVEEGMPAKYVDTEAMELLRCHRWPGNVRELENLVRRLVVLHSGDTISAAAVEAELREHARPLSVADGEDETLSAAIERHLHKMFVAPDGKLPPPGLYDRLLADLERPLISICLAATRGNQIRAAQLLGLNRNTLRKKIRELGLDIFRGLKAE
jgi:two-component system nitrogen regulation response regulator GlnG